MKSNEESYSSEFTPEELRMIYDVFDNLANKSLEKWTTLIPEEGKYRSEECYRQWILTGKLHAVRVKAGKKIGLNI